MLFPTSSELQIVNNHKFIKNQNHEHVDYLNKVCVKPWGHEFLVYQSQKIGIWCLKVLQNQKTSLHTHFNKDTFVIVISGCAKIELIDRVLCLNTMEYLYIPRYKFHSIGSFSRETVLLEIEVYNKQTNFTDKNDLLRIDDIYKRKDNIYQNSIQLISENLDIYDYFNLDNLSEKTIHNSNLSVMKVPNCESLIFDKNNIYILLNGVIYQNMKYLQEGSIITSNENINFLEDEVLILRIENISYKEDSKIIYNHEQLKVITEQLKFDNKNIILSSGCFDILHVGHIHNLLRAKSLGDVLMVCLSNDQQIKKLKGPERPVNNYDDRIDLFKTIKYVDYVILYEEIDIESESSLGEIMKLVDPYYWVKGSDYTIENIMKKHPYLKRVKLINNIENKSTTNIIRKINHKNI